MQAKVQRWGNSLALRLPKAVAEQVGIREGSSIDLEVRSGMLTLRARHQYRLQDLLAQIRPGNRHAEVSFGSRKGREEW